METKRYRAERLQSGLILVWDYHCAWGALYRVERNCVVECRGGNDSTAMRVAAHAFLNGEHRMGASAITARPHQSRLFCIALVLI